MTKAERAKLIDRLQTLAKRRDLANMDRVIQAHQCMNGCRAWRRGGDRQGSALCETCYYNEFI